MSTVRKGLLGAAVAVAAAVAYFLWTSSRSESLPAGFTSSNGRIEAVEIDVATKTAGRIEDVLVDEGDFIAAGQVLGRMDTDVLEAQLREAEAQFRQAKSAEDAARSNVTQREREKAAAESVVKQREAELDTESKHFTRIERLAAKGSATADELDVNRANFYRGKAAVDAAKAGVAAAAAAIATARSQVIGSEAAVEASKARIERLGVEINDCTLKSPRDGRVQYRIAQPGEVLNAGGKVLNLVDLSDVSMTFFLPTAAAGRVKMGTEVHLVLDAVPQYVIPAKVSFVADVAQFTPKTVETAEERQKLMFRIKARIDPGLLRQHIRSVKTGLPGMAYVPIVPGSEWPARLRVRLPR